ncbi:allantoin permease, partial [Klebsiella michiganensis]
IPLAITAARYNIDLDLITRSAGFGYFGSVITNIIFAGFTFIFFALEGSIMAQGLLVGLGIPLWMGYLIATLMVLPLVVYGMKALTRLQVWTTPLWLVLMVVPVAWLIAKDPDLVDGFMNFAGKNNASTVDLTAIMLGAGVCLSLIMQIGEQIDYLRFMPPKTAENSKSWWLAVFSAGPGWVVLGAIKQIIGAFLGFYLLTRFPAVHNTEPVQQFVSVFDNLVPGWLALTLAVVLV